MHLLSELQDVLLRFVFAPAGSDLKKSADPVAARCQKLEDEDFLIEYDNEQFINSSAVFSCKGPNQILVGPRVLTCMPDGRCSDVVQSGRPIFDDFFHHLWPYIGNNTANVVFQMVKRLWLIRIDQ
ncbi:hypothetical protein TNCV_2220191 [Trichonephila clavipes]|nr:hypothetical protein TNCV_2220191 [Trichonephila clavipes]